MGLPPLVEEDMKRMDSALMELLQRSEATAALIIDKGGPLICQCGDTERFDTTTISALAAGSFCATQAIAERCGEINFSSIYQQGDHTSILFRNIDEDLLLIVLFRAALSVGFDQVLRNQRGSGRGDANSKGAPAGFGHDSGFGFHERRRCLRYFPPYRSITRSGAKAGVSCQKEKAQGVEQIDSCAHAVGASAALNSARIHSN